MIKELVKFAHTLDSRGLYDEAKAIDEMVAELINRVGLVLEPQEMVSVANFLDENGYEKAASIIDEAISKTLNKE